MEHRNIRSVVDWAERYRSPYYRGLTDFSLCIDRNKDGPMELSRSEVINQGCPGIGCTSKIVVLHDPPHAVSDQASRDRRRFPRISELNDFSIERIEDDRGKLNNSRPKFSNQGQGMFKSNLVAEAFLSEGAFGHARDCELPSFQSNPSPYSRRYRRFSELVSLFEGTEDDRVKVTNSRPKLGNQVLDIPKSNLAHEGFLGEGGFGQAREPSLIQRNEPVSKPGETGHSRYIRVSNPTDMKNIWQGTSDIALYSYLNKSKLIEGQSESSKTKQNPFAIQLSYSHDEHPAHIIPTNPIQSENSDKASDGSSLNVKEGHSSLRPPSSTSTYNYQGHEFRPIFEQFIEPGGPKLPHDSVSLHSSLSLKHPQPFEEKILMSVSRNPPDHEFKNFGKGPRTHPGGAGAQDSKGRNTDEVCIEVLIGNDDEPDHIDHTGQTTFQTWNENFDEMMKMLQEKYSMMRMSETSLALGGQAIGAVMGNALTCTSTSCSRAVYLMELAIVLGISFTLAGIGLSGKKKRVLSILMTKLGAIATTSAILISLGSRLAPAIAWTVGPVAFLIMAIAVAFA